MLMAENKDNNIKVMTIKDLAEALRISYYSATRLVRLGKIKSIRCGRFYRISYLSFIEFLLSSNEKREEDD